MRLSFNVIDLFSGCGGSALGFAQAGFNIKVAVDIDAQASASFKKNFPDTAVITSDICYVSGKDLLRAGKLKNGNNTVIIACPPCQGFSSARRNAQKLSDPRNRLIVEFIRLVEDIKPFAFVMENVPGLSNGIGKPIFLQTLRKLNELGYHTVHAVLDSADFGIPQRRRRLVLIGTLLGNIRLQLPKPTNQNPDDKNRYLPPWNTVRNTISDLPAIKAGERLQSDPLHGSANLSVINLKRLQYTPSDGGNRTSWPEELILECHKKVNGYKDVYGRMRWDSPSPTMTGGCSMISKGRFGHPEQNRAISLREAARFQTFPDSYKFTGTFAQIAEQIGNAVPPLLAKKIAEALLNSIKDAEESERIVSENIFVGINPLVAFS